MNERCGPMSLCMLNCVLPSGVFSFLGVLVVAPISDQLNRGPVFV